MKPGRRQSAKEKKREARDWPKLHFTDTNDESLGKYYNPLKIQKSRSRFKKKNQLKMCIHF